MIFESSMQLWITHNGEREKLRFPVLPTKFDVTHGTKNTSVTISGLGEILVLQDRAAVEVSWDSFFPAAYFPGIQTPFMLSSPDAMIQRLFEWKLSAKPVHLILFGELPQRLDGDGNHGFIVILLVLLASLLAREEQGGYEE